MVPEHWGWHPWLFQVGNLAIPAYEFFVGLGLLAGLAVWFWEMRKEPSSATNAIYIICIALVGGGLGAKLPVWLFNFRQICAAFPNIGALLSGRTILGGIIGGTLAVNWFKKRVGIQGKFGNPIAPGLALGMAIGRIGCLCRGCCYGRPTQANWGIDLGDHILRHPVQLYDGCFNLLLFFYLMSLRKLDPPPGRLFHIYVTAYLSFRFLAEFVRAEPAVLGRLTMAQVAILLLLLYRMICYLRYRSLTKVGVGN